MAAKGVKVKTLSFNTMKLVKSRECMFTRRESIFNVELKMECVRPEGGIKGSSREKRMQAIAKSLVSPFHWLVHFDGKSHCQ
jgi:hypothetical protein